MSLPAALRPYRLGEAWIGLWARLVRRVYRPLVIGVTGSVGKTTTKETIAAVLMQPEAARRLGGVAKAPGISNSVIGMPLAVLGMRRRDGNRGLILDSLEAPVRAAALLFRARFPRVLVLEYGTSTPGRIERMVRSVPADIGIVTTIGPAHLEGLGSLAGIAAEKGALLAAVPPDGLSIIGNGHDFVDALAARSRAPVVTVAGDGGAALAGAIARVVARYLGVPDPLIERALAVNIEIEGRLRTIERSGFTILDDCYNANPVSMRHGLEALSKFSGVRRKVAIIGAMGELGAESECYHTEVGEQAHHCADLVIGVGGPARAYAPQHWFADNAQLIEALPHLLQPGDVVLVKGSHSAHLDRVVKHLAAAPQLDSNSAAPT